MPEGRDGAALPGADALGDALARLTAAVLPRDALDGWATVELDRAAVEVAAAVVGGRADRVPVGPTIEAAQPDRLLGAACRLLRWAGGARTLLLEPSTEGRLAAALARHGEGPIVRYLLVDAGATERARRAGFRVSAEAAGPLGPERLVLIGPRDGPFVILAGLD
jgi:hypothetical protein